MTEVELHGRMGAREFKKWQAMYRVDPWGPWRDDLRIGRLAALTANIHRSRNAELASSSDFMFDYERTREKDPEEVVAAVIDCISAFATYEPPPPTTPYELAAGGK